MDNTINISLQERENDNISSIRIDGVIDAITAGELERVIHSLMNRNRYHIIIDLAGVDYISSAGWGIFISHIKEVRTNSGDIKLVNLIDNVYEIYELLEFENVLKAYDSLEEARKDFGESVEPLKKKDKNSKVSVIDNVGTDSFNYSQNRQNNISNSPNMADIDPISYVLAQIKQDPFITISEIKHDFNKKSPSDHIGWWQIFAILKRHKLLSKRARFRFARQYYRS